MRSLQGLLAFLLCAGLARADQPPSPLRLIPDQADFVAQVHQPRKLLESVTQLEFVKQAQKLEAVKELLDSTQTRRFYQFLAYFEKQLGGSTNELLDRLAGGGIAVGAKFGDKAPALLVIQGTDAALMRKFLALGVEIVEQELARQELNVKFTKESHENLEVLRLGNDLHIALVESALLISNRAEALQKGLELATNKEKKSIASHAGLNEAMKLLPKDRLASLWLNMEPVRKSPMFEPFYKTPRDPFITINLGGLVDLLGRTPAVTAALCRDERGFLFTVRLPRGREGMGADRLVNCPPEGQPGSRPLLMPKDTLFSSSYFWDISQFWNERVALFGEERAKAIEEFDKNSGIALSSIGFSKLLTATGPYQRLVAVHQTKTGYKRQPKTPIPAFAMVVELRKPEEFARGLETLLRFGGLTATAQIGMTMVEEKYKGSDIVGYRFDEKKELREDINDIRFNFSPCFARAGNQYIFCSTIELCHELIDLLDREAKGQDRGSKPKSRTVFAASGVKETLVSFREQLIAASVLGQALPLEQAKAQVQALIALFDLADSLSLEENYGAKEYHLDIRANFKK
jgi:hypothetical protein